MNDISTATINWAEQKLAEAHSEEEVTIRSGWVTNLRGLFARQEQARKAGA